MDYDTWINKVDSFLVREVGLHHDDMEDWLWYDSFEAGDKPEEAAKEFLYEQDFYLD